MKYRKKPVIVEALLFDGNNYKECEGFIEGNYDNTLNYPNIKTLEGTMEVSVGDYIVKGVKNEFYPVKPDIFELTYENVHEGLSKYLDIVDKAIKESEKKDLTND